MNNHHPSQILAGFAANLRFDDIPQSVVPRAEALRLAGFSGAASEAEMRVAFERIWNIVDCTAVGTFLPASS
jgi:hypothetical protein